MSDPGPVSSCSDALSIASKLNNSIAFMKRKCEVDEGEDENDIQDKKSRLTDEGVEPTVDLQKSCSPDNCRPSQENKKGRRGKKGGMRRHKGVENSSSSRIDKQEVTPTDVIDVMSLSENRLMESDINNRQADVNDSSLTVAFEPITNAGLSLVCHSDLVNDNGVYVSTEILETEISIQSSQHSNDKSSLEDTVADKPLDNKLLESDLTEKTSENDNILKDSSKSRIEESKTCDKRKQIPRSKSTSKPKSVPHKESTQKLNLPQKNKYRENFIYGNYKRYYGYRSPELDVDVRLGYFPASLFEFKDVLDIGCNVGHVTFLIARDWKPKRILGLDIDRNLIEIAKKNIQYYMNDNARTDRRKNPVAAEKKNCPGDVCHSAFPSNVAFMQGNYVLEKDELVDLQREEYDVILALSITKWIHLNWGDEGLKRTFRRMFRQLRPGGKLVLEPQAWSSYQRKKKLTENILKNYQSIKFFPQQFRRFLLSKEVGFSSCEMLGVPDSKSQGFRRPLLLFTKKDISEAEGNQRPSDLNSEFIEKKLDAVDNESLNAASFSPDVSVSNAVAGDHIVVIENDDLTNAVDCIVSDTIANCKMLTSAEDEHHDVASEADDVKVSNSVDDMFTASVSLSISSS